MRSAPNRKKRQTRADTTLGRRLLTSAVGRWRLAGPRIEAILRFEGAHGAVRSATHGVFPLGVFTVTGYMIEAVTKQLNVANMGVSAGTFNADVG